jgi:hypothetical protein
MRGGRGRGGRGARACLLHLEAHGAVPNDLDAGDLLRADAGEGGRDDVAVALPRELHRAGGRERGARADRARPAPARGERPKEGVGVVGVGVEEVAGVGQEREHDGAAVQKGGCGGGGLV